MTMINLTWLNPPIEHRQEGDVHYVKTARKTDFWRETFYDFWRDDGHFLYQRVEGDFSAEVTVLGDYKVLYDQAGLMARLSETHWVKCGAELTDGELYFSVVVTNDTSDWSVLKIAVGAEGVRIRLTRHGESVRVQYLDVAKERWNMVRLAYLPPSRFIDVGMMCCSPEREGFEVEFSGFSVGPAIPRELHD
jgi:regulation of enolase protein 1 (concanavalin A-like superfamily)